MEATSAHSSCLASLFVSTLEQSFWHCAGRAFLCRMWKVPWLAFRSLKKLAWYSPFSYYDFVRGAIYWRLALVPRTLRGARPRLPYTRLRSDETSVPSYITIHRLPRSANCCSFDFRDTHFSLYLPSHSLPTRVYLFASNHCLTRYSAIYFYLRFSHLVRPRRQPTTPIDVDPRIRHHIPSSSLDRSWKEVVVPHVRVHLLQPRHQCHLFRLSRCGRYQQIWSLALRQT